VTITAGGLVIIGLTGGGANHPQHASLAALIAVEGAIFTVGAALVRVSARRHVLPRAEGLLLGAAGGALFGVSEAFRATVPKPGVSMTVIAGRGFMTTRRLFASGTTVTSKNCIAACDAPVLWSVALATTASENAPVSSPWGTSCTVARSLGATVH
jgi:hypothetical protein